jgi:hypothetical protein
VVLFAQNAEQQYALVQLIPERLRKELKYVLILLLTLTSLIRLKINY